jgi:hypothetical protein
VGATSSRAVPKQSSTFNDLKLALMQALYKNPNQGIQQIINKLERTANVKRENVSLSIICVFIIIVWFSSFTSLPPCCPFI